MSPSRVTKKSNCSDKKKVKLLRVETTPQKLEGVQLPKLVILGLTKNAKTVRQDTEIPGLGKITLYRTTREVALAPGPERLTDIGLNQFVPLNKKLLQAVRHLPAPSTESQ